MLHVKNDIVFYTKGKKASSQSLSSWDISYPHVFTSMRVSSGRVLFLKSHVKRLLLGANYLFLKYKFDWPLKDEIQRGIDKIQNFLGGEFRIKVVLSPELLLIMAREVQEKYSSYSAINLGKAKNVKTSHRPSFLKIDDYKKSIDEIIRIKKEGYDDILYLDCAENIMECSFSNLFFVLKEQIYTPKLRPGILAGITRQKLIDCLKEKDIFIHDLDISWNQLHDADEIWQTNSIKGIRPVKMLGDKILTRFQSENSLTNKVSLLFADYCRVHYE